MEEDAFKATQILTDSRVCTETSKATEVVKVKRTCTMAEEEPTQVVTWEAVVAVKAEAVPT